MCVCVWGGGGGGGGVNGLCLHIDIYTRVPKIDKIIHASSNTRVYGGQ